MVPVFLICIFLNHISLQVDAKDLSSIEQILVGGPIHEAKNEILELKEKAIEHSEVGTPLKLTDSLHFISHSGSISNTIQLAI